MADFPVQHVYTKTVWAAAWVEKDYIEPQVASLNTAPNIDTAVFLWRFGRIKREDETALATVAPLDIVGHYIQVREADETTVLWTGVVIDNSLTNLRQHAINSVDYNAGDQVLTARGIEYFFERTQIQGTKVASGTLGRTIPLNQFNPHGNSPLGNRSTSTIAVHSRDVYLFSEDGEIWSVKTFIEHLLILYVDFDIEFQLTGDSAAILTALDAIKPLHLNYDGMTVSQILNKLIDRRRGLGWRVNVDESTSDPGTAAATVSVHVFSLLGSSITAGGVTLPANANKLTVDLTDANFTSVTVNKTSNQEYDEIMVRGERIRSMFSLSFNDTTLEKYWSAAQETDYRTGTDMGATTAEANDIERADNRFEHVYTTYRVPTDWDHKAGDGEGGDKYFVVPHADDDGTIDFTAVGNYARFSREFLDTLPKSKTVTATDANPEYMESFAVVLSPINDQWVDSRGLAAINLTPIELRPLSGDLAVQLASNVNHILGLNHFVYDTDDESLVSPSLDYEEIIVTVAMELDERIHVSKATGISTGNDYRTKVIDVEDAHMWIIAPGTVTGVEAGSLVKHTGTTDALRTLRDDSDLLRLIAEAAVSWYGVERHTIRLQSNVINNDAPPGYYILSSWGGLADVQVNSVVTSVNYDFTSGTTIILTGYEELDFSQ